MFRRLVGCAVTALVASTCLVATSAPANAGPAFEINYATKRALGDYPGKCFADTYQGGYEMDPHYTACFQLKGDYFWAGDYRPDGNAAVLKWAFEAKQDGSGSDVRRGLCISTHGHGAHSCNKDLPEKGYLEIWAGYRTKSGSTSTSDMKFGGRLCMMLDGPGFYNFGCLDR